MFSNLVSTQGFLGALVAVVLFPIWLIFHYLYFIPMIRREAAKANMSYEDYVEHRYTSHIRDYAPMLEKIENTTGTDC